MTHWVMHESHAENLRWMQVKLRNCSHTKPSPLAVLVTLMPHLPQIWLTTSLPAAGAQRGPAEQRSCNFRACKYFTGNDCGKPRK